jgi:hypothetical protein
MWRQARFLKLHSLGHLKDCESYVYFGAIGFINFLDTLLVKKSILRFITMYFQQMCGDKEAPVATFVAHGFLTLDTADLEEDNQA